MGEDTKVSTTVKNAMNDFSFNKTHLKSLPLYLDDVNVIAIENEETFYRVPYLHHQLDHIV
jgi:hypothetical protein